MGIKDDQFLEKLLAAFRIEADEHLKAIEAGLLELERSPEESKAAEIIETIYREAHSLKGAARSVNKTEIESVCQAAESVLGALKAGKIGPSTELFDTLHRSNDTVNDILGEATDVEIQPIVDELLGLLARKPEDTVSSARAGKRTPPKKMPKAPQPRENGPDEKMPEPDEARDEPPVHRKPQEHVPTAAVGGEAQREEGPLTSSGSGVESAQQTASRKRERSFQTDTVRIAVDKLDPLLRQVEEMVSVKLTGNQRVTDLVGVLSTIGQWKQKWNNLSSHDKSIGKILVRKGELASSSLTDSQFSKLVDFLNWNETFVKMLEDRIKTVSRSADGDARMHGQMVDDLLEDMMNVLMLPCSSLMEVFPKLVRDLSRDAGKDVYLEIRGGDLEIDRRILEEMKDPLIHLVRNAIDHGIEMPAERERNGKPRRGTVTIAFSQISGNQVELLVADDGAGIDVAGVREAASRKGVLSEQDKMKTDGQDAISLVFRSEVSTSSKVTSISGRGLGLAIVREKVENLGGNVSVATAPAMGTSFRILLPVTLSTFRGILVQAHNQPFIIPTANVERVARIKKEIVKSVGNRDTIEVDGRPIPLVKLGDTLELPRPDVKDANSEFVPVLILRSGERLVSFSVDHILQEQEVLVKGLGRQLSRVRNVAGATVLGSGRLVPILNVQDLVKSATKRAFSHTGPALPVEAIEYTSKNVLVVEDSITSRMLLKNILESSGYNVTTSVDGADAWAALKSNRFDCVVSDIEMPKMDGFELTANIRADDELGTLPVILVTSLGSREDRERGIDVGANAYIVKGSFDQNNLLETVERLV